MSVPAENIGIVTMGREDARLVALSAPHSMAAEQYRVLLGRIDRAGAARSLRTVAVTSCARGEGRTMTAVNLALTAARDGREVLLVECDLRRPSIATLFDLTIRAGLAEVVEGTAELPEVLSHVAGLTVLCAGDAADPVSLVRNPRLGAIFDTLRSSFPLVVLDAPPALALSDAGRITAAVDGIVLVVRAGETPRDVVKMAIDSLPDRLLGIVLNGVDEPAYARYLKQEATAP